MGARRLGHIIDLFGSIFSMSSFNPIICVDFDGVIHSYTSGWKGVDVIPDPPVYGAIEWIEDHLPQPAAYGGLAWMHEGPIVQIYSSRSKSWRGRRAMKKWLIENGLDEWYIKENILKFPTKKPAAFLTIDDRAICFDGYFPSTQEMMSFKPWYKDSRLVDNDSDTNIDDLLVTRPGDIVRTLGGSVITSTLPNQAQKKGLTRHDKT